MDFTQTLKSSSPSEWRTRQAIIFDWFDGPREGVCALNQPAVEFAFELVDERHNPDGLDDRIFRVKELPPGSVDQISATLTDLGGPTHSVWVPIWKFPSQAKQQLAESKIQEILSRAQSASATVATRDLERFVGCWPIEVNPSAIGQSPWSFESHSPDQVVR